MSSLRHAGYKFPYRHPPASGMLEKALSALGSVFRGLGSTLDEVGAIMQGSAAGKETGVKVLSNPGCAFTRMPAVQPNLAWAPTVPDPSRPPAAGQAVKVPPVSRVPPLPSIVMPVRGSAVFIAPSANVLGDVKIGDNSSIWYGAVLRGDVNSIQIGSNTNIQDNVVIHVAKHSLSGQARPTIIGDNVTIGHGATVHACSIGSNSLVGMGATVLDGCEVASGAIVAAGAVLPPNTKVKSGEVWAGSPAKLLREVEDDEVQFIKTSAMNYALLAAAHRYENGKSFEELVTESNIEAERFIAADPSNSVHQMWVFDSQTMLAVRPKK